jgi:very-long-chain (3R)-3-hydroxyacyl-CoA dehydratase
MHLPCPERWHRQVQVSVCGVSTWCARPHLFTESIVHFVALFQMLSFVEVIHALLGLVRGSPVAALLQWTGRANVLYAVVLAIPEIKASIPAGAMLMAWALSEIIRYPWYAAQLKGTCPFWLTWLRYTMFIPLYPIGVLGEILSIYNALPVIEGKGMYSIRLPNAWNFGFDYAVFMKIVLALYPFLWWQLYAMLLAARSKRLPGTKRASISNAFASNRTQKKSSRLL